MNSNHDEGTKEDLRTIKKRGIIYASISLSLCAIGCIGYFALPALGVYIPYITIIYVVCLVLWGTFAGLALYCVNNYRYIDSDGKKQGGGIVWFLLLVLGLFVFPVLIVTFGKKSQKFTELVLGIEYESADPEDDDESP